MHTHTLTCIYIYIFGGNLKFLPISQSEGPTKAPDVPFWWRWILALWIWLILNDHLRSPQRMCRNRKRAGWPASGALDEIRPAGLFLLPLHCQQRSVTPVSSPWGPRGGRTCFWGQLSFLVLDHWCL